jgi:RNA polymerase sigma-70 factor, ECF subfamily
MHGAPAPEMSDEALLQRARLGERDAFAALYARYQHIVFRFARAMTGSADAAEDVTQEVFVAFIRDLPRYDASRAALATYLYGVARNLSRHRLRRERRFRSLDEAGASPAGGGRHDDHADSLVSAQAIASLRRALHALPSRYREVIVLCDLHELPCTVAAQIVGATATAVRSRLFRGRQMLKQRIQRLEQSPMRPAAHPTRCSI